MDPITWIVTPFVVIWNAAPVEFWIAGAGIVVLGWSFVGLRLLASSYWRRRPTD